MKRVVLVALTMVMAASTALAQNKPAQGTAPTQQPAAGSQAQQPAGTQAQPKQPQAKTTEEFTAFQTANQSSDPAAAETSADEFAAKYPESELRSLLYQRTMSLYQQNNNADKVIEVGRKALSIDPNEPVTLISVANVLAERTRETDLDKNERLADATKFANRGLEMIENIQAPAGVTPEQLVNAKNELRSVALGTLGMVAYTNKDYAGAEAQFRKSIGAFSVQPDPTIHLRLTLSLDKQQKYAEALTAANKTLEIAPADSQVAQLAKQEKERLTKLVNAPAPKPAAAPTSPQPTTVPPK
ncbi:MAG TPA: tetratricopeptide repeat protein [Clostridia bacterium]|nr:tetratricopeptide repeat protein [Clostridia bacterium]